jgi:hypothetical protein
MVYLGKTVFVILTITKVNSNITLPIIDNNIEDFDSTILKQYDIYLIKA